MLYRAAMKVKIGKYPTHRWYHNFLYEKLGIKNEPKISVQVDPWDTWSMDSTLAHIIVPMLEQLRETTHGAPYVEDEDRPPQFLGTVIDKNSGAVDEFYFNAWDWALGEMLFAFESKNEDYEGQIVYQERITNGFRLFGKYYENLWD